MTREGDTEWMSEPRGRLLFKTSRETTNRGIVLLGEYLAILLAGISVREFVADKLMWSVVGAGWLLFFAAYFAGRTIAVYEGGVEIPVRYRRYFLPWNAIASAVWIDNK